MALLDQLLPKKRKKTESQLGYELVEYLIRNPKAKGQFHFSGLSSLAWFQLLSRRPEFIDRCNTAKISPDHVTEIIIAQPQLLPYFPPSRMNWRKVLSKRPELVDKMPKDRRHIPRNSWMRILCCQPGLWDYSPKNFTRDEWAELISQQPGFWDHSPKNFTSEEWVELISRHPGFWDHSPKNFTREEWAELISRQPGLWDHSPKRFTSKEWSGIIIRQPQLADKCPWKKMRLDAHNSDWKIGLLKHPETVLAHRPDWKEYYNLENLTGEQLVDLLKSNPEIVKLADFPTVVNSDMWELILESDPQLVKYCNVKKYFPRTPLSLILRKPELAKFFDMDNIYSDYFLPGFHSRQVMDFINSHPEFAEKVLTFLEGDDWVKVLFDHPEYLLKREGWRFSFRENTMAFAAAEFWDFERTGLDSICNRVYTWLTKPLSPLDGLFQDASQNEVPPGDFLLKKTMDPANARSYFFQQLEQGKWDFIAGINDIDPDSFSTFIKAEDIPFLWCAAAPQPVLEKLLDPVPDPAACRDQNGNTLLHAALLRAAFDDARSLLDTDNPYRARYDYLLKRGCDPDQKNKFGFSCNDLIDMIRRFPHTEG